MLKNLTLRTKAIVFAVALGTLPVIGCGTVAYYFTARSFTQEISESQKVVVADLQDKVTGYMRERFGDIQIMAKLDVFADPKLRESTSIAEKTAALKRFQDAYGIYDSIAVFDLKGDLIAQTEGKTLGNHLNRTYIQEALKANGAILSQPTISTSSGTFSVYAASTIKDQVTGQPIGVIRARMPVKHLEATIENYRKRGNQAYLINAAGEVFIGPEGVYVTDSLSSGASADNTEADYQAIEAQTIYPVLEQLQAANQLDTAISNNAIANTRQLLSYSPPVSLEGMTDLNWQAIIAKDTDAVFAPQRKVLWTIVFGTGVAALVSTGLAVVFANRTTKFLKGIANAIASSSQEIATTVGQQESNINQQATSVSQTTTTMDELGASTRQSAEQAEASASGAQQALNCAEKGTKSVQQTLEGMEVLKGKVSAIAQQILHLNEQTVEIGGMSDLVSDLANQTNMLALNASVEAARAGEQGRGFNVVATEIGKLAEQSQQSAEKINNLVRDIQAALNSTVTVTKEGTQEAEAGIVLAQGTSATFSEVADAVNNVFLNSQQITMTAKQQAVAVQQVLSAIGEVNLAAQESASGITQVKGSTQNLKETAQKLQKMV